MEKENTQQLRQHVLEELEAIGFARVTDCLQVEEDQLIVKGLDGSAGAAVASIERSGGSWKVKFYDKLKALELLGKHLGMFAGNLRREEKQTNNLLESILRATEGEVDTDDIPEIQQAAAAGDDLVEPKKSQGV